MKEIYHKSLECKIEMLRQKMHVTVLGKGISHPDVLMVSQRLDEVMNEVHKLALIENPV